MPEKNQEEIILVCEKCNEPFHARVISRPVKTQSPISMRCASELFCPNCGRVANLINQFKKQKNAQKAKSKA